MDREEAVKHLRKTFGFDDFRDNQWEIIEKILNGKKILLVAKTNFGKSLCYQFPATIFDGITLVFSPLIALMRDQVDFLKQKWIPATAINSDNSNSTNSATKINEEILKEAQKGKYKILYIAPERIDNKIWRKYLPDLKISMIVVDEAHCISTWGHDFRPHYRMIKDMIKTLPKNIPALAVTATADDYIAKDVKKQLQTFMDDEIEIIRNDLCRPNIKIKVVKIKAEKQDKLSFLVKYLKRSTGTGIIYASSIKKAWKYSQWLREGGIDAAVYHSQVDDRRKIERDFYNNKYKCVVATNALGMGIDKKDIRFIIHANIPGSLIQYYQEIGRAGRDEKPADAILLYRERDREIQDFFIGQSKPSREKYERVIEFLKNNSVGRSKIMAACDINSNEFKIIITDLLEQDVVFKRTLERNFYYEYNPDSKGLDYSLVEKLKKHKMKMLNDMIDFANSTNPDMNYICKYLGQRKDRKYDTASDSYKEYAIKRFFKALASFFKR